MKKRIWYSNFTKATARLSGRSLTFTFAVLIIVVWIATGPFFHYSDTWQLVINTATTIITFLMVFVIQNTQNRDTGAIQVKLDELIRATQGAHNVLLDLEELEEEQINYFREQYKEHARMERASLLVDGGVDTGTAETKNY